MRENGVVAGNVFDSLIFDFRARPGIPGAGVQGMSGRTNSQQINHHQFAEVLPARVQKT